IPLGEFIEDCSPRRVGECLVHVAHSEQYRQAITCLSTSSGYGLALTVESPGMELPGMELPGMKLVVSGMRSADIPLMSSHTESEERPTRISTLSQPGQRPTNPGSGPYTRNVATCDELPQPRHRPTAVVISTPNTS